MKEKGPPKEPPKYLEDEIINVVVLGQVNETYVQAEFNITRLAYEPEDDEDQKAEEDGDKKKDDLQKEDLKKKLVKKEASENSKLDEKSAKETKAHKRAQQLRERAHGRGANIHIVEKSSSGNSDTVTLTPTPRIVPGLNDDAGGPGERVLARGSVPGEESNNTASSTSPAPARRRLLEANELAAPEFWDTRLMPEDIASIVIVDSVPVSESPDSAVIMAEDWSIEDEELADWITNQKQKQLLMLQLEDAKHVHDSVIALLDDEFGATFPWEETDDLDELGRLEMLFRRSRLSSSRKLLMDTFADSLRWVNNLYNTAYGKEVRKVPSHMPHFVDKNIMAELHATWPERFYQTSSHRFRHPKDMQFSFSYMYYMMNARWKYDPQKIWKELDANGDGKLDRQESDFLTLLISEKKDEYHPDDVYELLVNASNTLTPSFSGTPSFTYNVFVRTQFLQDKLKEIVEKKKKYKHQEMGLEQVAFFLSLSVVVNHPLCSNESNCLGLVICMRNPVTYLTHNPVTH